MKSTYDQMHEAMERDGDPSDDTLNYIEETTLWPRMAENRAKNVSCLELKNATERCRKKYGTILGFMCAYDNLFYSRCVNEKKNNEDLKDDCLEEYIALRSKYRLTKDPKVLNRMKGMVFPSQYKENPEETKSPNSF